MRKRPGPAWIRRNSNNENENRPEPQCTASIIILLIVIFLQAGPLLTYVTKYVGGNGVPICAVWELLYLKTASFM